MRTSLALLLFSLSLVVGACSSGGRREPQQPEAGPAAGPEAETARWPTALECVVTYENPSLSVEGTRAAEVIGTALDEAGIQWISAGSRGFSVNVDVTDAARARELIAEVIEEHALEALVYAARQ